MKRKRSAVQVAGLVLWRGGMAFAAASSLYYGAWHYLQNLQWPMQIKVGVALAVAGTVLVLLSLIAERRKDAAGEGGFKE